MRPLPHKVVDTVQEGEIDRPRLQIGFGWIGRFVFKLVVYPLILTPIMAIAICVVFYWGDERTCQKAPLRGIGMGLFEPR